MGEPTGSTSTAWMFSVLANSTVTHLDVASQLSGLSKSGSLYKNKWILIRDGYVRANFLCKKCEDNHLGLYFAMPRSLEFLMVPLKGRDAYHFFTLLSLCIID